MNFRLAKAKVIEIQERVYYNDCIGNLTLFPLLKNKKTYANVVSGLLVRRVRTLPLVLSSGRKK